VRGSEFKITRSDDPSHIPLLQTTGDCLGGQTFRSKITSYDSLLNLLRRSEVFIIDCVVMNCIQSANKIGFWCDWNGGDGAVMMIGGGGEPSIATVLLKAKTYGQKKKNLKKSLPLSDDVTES
ncbi:uncharacterized protein LOC113671751, partial [Pocillopora damicornis]|uniref:uncharacterized protein LOC113671751 n=1 Tax=Pocillopora damicornis TaxID=46731 RepID=UPI000F555761